MGDGTTIEYHGRRWRWALGTLLAATASVQAGSMGHTREPAARSNAHPPEIVTLSTRLKGAHPDAQLGPCLGRSNTDVRLNR